MGQFIKFEDSSSSERGSLTSAGEKLGNYFPRDIIFVFRSFFIGCFSCGSNDWIKECSDSRNYWVLVVYSCKFETNMLSTYQEELQEMEGQSKEEYIGSLRRKSSGFSPGVSKYRCSKDVDVEDEHDEDSSDSNEDGDS